MIGTLKADALGSSTLAFVTAIRTVRMTIAHPPVRQTKDSVVTEEVVGWTVNSLYQGRWSVVAILFVTTVTAIIFAVTMPDVGNAFTVLAVEPARWTIGGGHLTLRLRFNDWGTGAAVSGCDE
jgi:hypothetical protein